MRSMGTMRHRRGARLCRRLVRYARRSLQAVQGGRDHWIEAQYRFLSTQSEEALVQQVHGDSRTARIDTPATFQGDLAGFDLVVMR